MSARLFSIAATLFALTLAGCGAQVAMHDPRIPAPLIAKMPLNVGVRYPDVFESFVHEERVIGKEEWKIDLGRSNRLLFDKLFGSMFTGMRVLGAADDAKSLGLDAVIEPSIDAFEFSVPEQSQTDAFAVWIRYRIKIFDRDGNQVANWPISAYGKSQSSTFGGDDALRHAAVLAMRDAAALVILQMDKSTGISKLAQPPTGEPDLNVATPAALQTTAKEDNPDETG